MATDYTRRPRGYIPRQAIGARRNQRGEVGPGAPMAPANNLALSAPHDWSSFDAFGARNAARPIPGTTPTAPRPAPVAPTGANPFVRTSGAGSNFVGAMGNAARAVAAPAIAAANQTDSARNTPPAAELPARRFVPGVGAEVLRYDTAGNPRYISTQPTVDELQEQRIPGWSRMTPEQRAQALTGLRPMPSAAKPQQTQPKATETSDSFSRTRTVQIDPKYGGGVGTAVTQTAPVPFTPPVAIAGSAAKAAGGAGLAGQLVANPVEGPSPVSAFDRGVQAGEAIAQAPGVAASVPPMASAAPAINTTPVPNPIMQKGQAVDAFMGGMRGSLLPPPTPIKLDPTAPLAPAAPRVAPAGAGWNEKALSDSVAPAPETPAWNMKPKKPEEENAFSLPKRILRGAARQPSYLAP